MQPSATEPQIPHLSLSGVTRRYGEVVAVDHVTFSIAHGERISLLGPSGCGKTTLLGLIAGFSPLDGGRIEVRGSNLDRVPSHRRNFGVVFQNYALFPHMSVADNVRFGLRMRSVPAGKADRQVREALALVQLDAYGERFPAQLSGGQQQRVAIARALAIQPEILLLDEPLSNLDAKLREEMRTDLLDILERLKVTTVLVTHDQAEALALSNRVVLLNAGRVEQIGTPQEIYEQPATPFAAKFLGESNLLHGRVVEPGPHGTLCELPGGFHVRTRALAGVASGDSVEMIIRLESILLDAAAAQGDENSFDVEMEHVVFLGSEVRYVLRLGPNRIIAVDKNRSGRSAGITGSPIRIRWSAQDMFLARRGEDEGAQAPRFAGGALPRRETAAARSN